MSMGMAMGMAMVDLILTGKVLFLLALANGAPVIGTKIFGETMASPVDGGLRLRDGQPLFGPSKTIRGLVLALGVTMLFAPSIGLGFGTGALVSLAAMAGDLLSSFAKRRLKMPPSSMAIGLDHIPEAFLPALVARSVLPLTGWDIVAIVFAFLVGALLVSRLFFALKIRDRPY